MKKYILFLMSFLLIPYCFAFTYFVSYTGNDSNPGSKSLPFKSIQTAVNKAIAGDSIIVSEGTYSEKVTFPNSGTASDQIVMKGLGRVVIKANSEVTRWSGIINIVKKEYIVVENIKLLDSYWFGFYINLGSDNIRIKNCSTYNTGSSGIYAASSNHIYFDSNTVRKACYQSLSTTASQECITLSNVNYFRIADNEVYESGGSTNGGEGINTKNGTKNGKVARNKVHDLIRLGIYVDAFDLSCENIEVYSNKIYRCENGIALASEQGGLVKNINLYNNVVYRNRANGIIVSAWVNNGPKRNIKISNNTCYKNGSNNWGGGIIIEKDAADSITITNNICYDNLMWGISTPLGINSIITNNLTYPFNNYSWTSEIPGINYVSINPLFTNPVNDDFTLKLNSPAIKAGTSINAPKFDITGLQVNICCIDLGAYKYQPSSLLKEELITSYEENEFPQNTIRITNETGKRAVKIEMENSSGTPVTVNVSDLKGNTIATAIFDYSSYTIDLSTQFPGIYIVKAQSQNIQNTCKVLLQ